MKQLLSNLKAGQEFILNRSNKRYQVIYQSTNSRVRVQGLGDVKQAWLNGQCEVIVEGDEV